MVFILSRDLHRVSEGYLKATSINNNLAGS